MAGRAVHPARRQSWVAGTAGAWGHGTRLVLEEDLLWGELDGLDLLYLLYWLQVLQRVYLMDGLAIDRWQIVADLIYVGKNWRVIGVDNLSARRGAAVHRLHLSLGGHEESVHFTDAVLLSRVSMSGVQ